MLLTLDLPLDARAQRFALETALGAGCTLVLCDAVPVGPNSAAAVLRMRGRPDAEASLRAAAAEARSLGIHVDELIFHSPRPLPAATSLCAARGIGLLVFGPSPAAAGRLRYRRWAHRVRRDMPCLVWLPED
jgi:nucleotide-binding universal stress UspA family protein